MARATKVESSDPALLLVEQYLDRFPGEAIEVLEELSIDDLAVFVEGVDTDRGAQVLEKMSEFRAADCLTRIGESALKRIASRIDPYHFSLIISRLSAEQRELLLASVEPRVADEVRALMSYPADTAGSLMDTRVLSFRPRDTVKAVLARLGSWHRRDTRYVLVTDDEGRLLGLLPLTDVALAPLRQRLELLVKDPAPRVSAMAPKEDVLNVLTASGIGMVPVVDGQQRLLGVIRQESIIQVVKEDATADLATLVGASKDELALSPPLFAVKKRLPWLNINLLTAFLAASVVGLFESTIAQFTALAVLLPVVAGQSGNTGAQALAVVIRGLALREIRASDAGPVMIKEAIAGTVNGVAIAVVTVIAVYVWSGSMGLCLVIFLAMILAMAIAGVAGAAIPLVLSSLKQDPAQSGSIILTTVTDVFGFFSFLGLATVFSSML
jgi:magnesium transporter